MNIHKVAILAIMVAALVGSCASDPKRTEAGGVAVGVEVYSPLQKSNNRFYASGKVVAAQTAMISTRIMGFVNKVYVKPGDKVVQGQRLIGISNSDISAKRAQVLAMISEAEAATKNAERDYERFKILREQNSVSQKELENVSLQLTSMQSKLKMAKESLVEVNAMLSYANICAPYSGVITQKNVDEGSMANPGMPLLMLESNGALQVQASISEDNIASLKKGEKVQISIKSLNKTIEGTIAEVSPSASMTGGQYLIKVNFNQADAPDVYSGMYAKVFIESDNTDDTLNSTMVYEKSIVHREQLTGVYVVNENNEAFLRWVKLGRKEGDMVEVLSGIQKTDKIVLSTKKKLINGQKVTIGG